MKRIAILSYSGGIISTGYLLKLLNDQNYDMVYPLFFNYEKQFDIEEKSADSVIDYIEKEDTLKNKLEYTKIEIKVNDYNLKQISEIKDSNEVSRKVLFLNYDALISLAEDLHYANPEIKIDIHVGNNLEESEEYKNENEIAYNHALNIIDKEYIRIDRDCTSLTKEDVIRESLILCKNLNLDFFELFKRTNTTPRTIKIKNRLYVDINHPKSSERILAFYKIGLADPLKYANENEILTWEEAKEYYGVSSIKDEYGIVSEEDIKPIPIKRPTVNIPQFEPETKHPRKTYNSGVELN